MRGVKICGLCRPADAALAQAAGVTHAGVILGAGGPREQTPAAARRIYDAAPALRRVGVFADQPAERVREIATILSLDVVQLHGAEDAGTLAAVAGPWDIWKAVRPRTAAELVTLRDAWAEFVDALMVEGSSRGGMGIRAPWEALAPRWDGDPALVLAGGLRPENVAGAIALLDPDVVDVSSGVEASTGVKDADRVHAFVRAALGRVHPGLS